VLLKLTNQRLLRAARPNFAASEFQNLEISMKPLFLAGLIVLVAGVVLLFVPIPHRESRGIKSGDMSIGITTTHHERVSPIISAVMIIAGAGMMLGGRGR